MKTRQNPNPFSSKPLAVAIALLMMFNLLATGCATAPTTLAKTDNDVFDLVIQADKAYEQGRWLAAEQGYQAVIKNVPEDAYAWLRLGNTRLRQTHYQGAIHAYKAALQRDPGQAKAYYNLATVYLLLAQQSLEEAQNRLPSDSRESIYLKRQRLTPLIYDALAEIPSPVNGLIDPLAVARGHVQGASHKNIYKP